MTDVDLTGGTPRDITVDITSEELISMHALYEEFHRHPELSMQEYKTQERIERELDLLGIENFRCGGTGVVGVLSQGDGPTIAFRADTDGLPIKEATGLEYASTAQGTLPDGSLAPVMHGCGHDTHITSLLMTARILLRESHRWSGTVVLIFQPGEETAAGARAMVEDGLWDKAPKPSVVFGQHVSPNKAGTIALASGPAMAMADSLRVTVKGKQTHGSQPEHGVDPIVAASAMVMRLQTIVSRDLSPLDNAVVTVGTFHAGLKENIIPETAEFTINIRSLTSEVRETVLASIHRIVTAEAAAAGAEEPSIEKIYDFPLNFNDLETTAESRKVLESVLGEAAVEDAGPMMGSEDFGLLGQAIDVPSVFWFFGGAEEPGGPTNHSPYFAPLQEPTLTTGVKCATATLLYWLNR